jgi:hypothetical protein
MNLFILIIGHPRCGTSSIAKYFNTMGYNIGHEIIKTNGISSWMMAVESHNYPWGGALNKNTYVFDKTIHLIRNPFNSFPSIILENKYSVNNNSYKFRKKFINSILSIDLTPYEHDDLQLAILTYIYWNQICTLNNPDYIIKIENLNDLEIFNTDNKILKLVQSNKTIDKHFFIKGSYKKINKPIITQNMYLSLPIFIKTLLIDFCKLYSYDIQF